MMQAGKMFSPVFVQYVLPNDDKPLPKKHLRDYSNPFELPVERFVELFRFPQFAAKTMVDILNAFLFNVGNIPDVPPYLRALATIRYLTTGAYDPIEELPISKQIIIYSIEEVLDIANKYLAAQWINIPRVAGYDNIKKGFFEQFGFPGAIGAVGIANFAVTCYPEKREEYLNNTTPDGFTSVKVLIACDHRLMIRFIEPRNKSKALDECVFGVSQLKQTLMARGIENLGPGWLIGDVQAPCRPYLVTPIPYTREDTPEHRYNAAHKRAARETVRRVVAMLRARFSVLLDPSSLVAMSDMYARVIITCAVLHNMLVDQHPYLKVPADAGVEAAMREHAIDELSAPLAENQVMSRDFVDRNNIVQQYFV